MDGRVAEIELKEPDYRGMIKTEIRFLFTEGVCQRVDKMSSRDFQKAKIKPQGFSLIELLIALVILSISFLGLASLMVQTTNNNSFGYSMTEAAIFAQDQLENFKTTPWANVVTGNDVRQGSTGTNYTRRWVVVPNIAPPNDTVKEITITIGWNDKANHSVDFRSVINRPLIN
jgi:prepilin-type N-terminal cleavage/methylation domain-containing protein